MTIELKNIGKSYDGNSWTLNDITTEIESGEFFAIVGPSGCGKSTLLRMIAGLISISEGEIEIDGKDVTNLPPQDRNLTMVFQNYALFPFLSVRDNVAFGLKEHKMDAEEIKRRVDEALDMVNLTEYGDRKPRDLSGGQRQRVAVARAIASDAEICLMDEPLSNLDVQLRGKMRSEIRMLQQKLGLTMIYVTHDQVEAMTMADRIMVLHDSKIQQIGTPLEIYNHPANTFVAEFFGTPRMNLLEATYDARLNKLVVDESLEFDCEDGMDRDDYIVGVRPSGFSVEKAADRSNARVVNAEYLGNMSIIELELDGGDEIRVTVDDDMNHDWMINQRMLVKPQGIFYIFDKTGKLFAKGGSSSGTSRSEEEFVATAAR